MNTTVPVVGRHRRTPTTGHVPTDRTHAVHTDDFRIEGGTVHALLPCARCHPKEYAMVGAKHRRSDRP